jgi:hypothetical protein
VAPALRLEIATLEHGFFTREAIAERKQRRDLLREAIAILRRFESTFD